jgi:hypothetical protein
MTPTMQLPPDTLAEQVAYAVSGDVACTENWPAIRDAIVKRAQEALDSERQRVLYAVRDIAGLEVALKVQEATVPRPGLAKPHRKDEPGHEPTPCALLVRRRRAHREDAGL